MVAVALTSREPSRVYDGWFVRISKGFVSNVCFLDLLPRLKLPIAQIQGLEIVSHTGCSAQRVLRHGWSLVLYIRSLLPRFEGTNQLIVILPI